MKNGIINARNAVAYRHRQRGASLLEGIAYLGIAAIVILGAVSLLTNAFSSAQSNRTTEEIVSLRTAVRKLYSGQVYPSDVTTVVMTANAQPATLTTGTSGGNSALINSWGGTVTITGNNSAASNTFTIGYTLVPQAECVNILSGLNGWTKVASDSNAGGTTTFPLKPADAADICKSATNTISLTSM